MLYLPYYFLLSLFERWRWRQVYGDLGGVLVKWLSAFSLLLFIVLNVVGGYGHVWTGISHFDVSIALFLLRCTVVY